MPTQRRSRTERAAGKRRPASLPEHLESAQGALASGSGLDGVRIVGDLVARPGDRAVTDARLSASRWSAGRLTGQHFRGLRCVDVVFDNCDLSGVITEGSTLKGVEFHECRMSGIVLAGARMEDVLFSRCKLDMANLRMLDGIRVEFLGSDLREADFYAAQLAATGIYDSDLSCADFSHASPRRLRLHGSSLHGLKGASALDGAVISREQLVDMSMALFDASGITVDDER